MGKGVDNWEGWTMKGWYSRRKNHLRMDVVPLCCTWIWYWMGWSLGRVKYGVPYGANIDIENGSMNMIFIGRRSSSAKEKRRRERKEVVRP